MRFISLKSVATRKPITLHYRQQIEIIACEPQETPGGRSGFDRQTNRRAMRILDALDACKLGNVLTLEDADWDFLKARLDVFIWPWADPVFEDFCQHIEDAPREAVVPLAEDGASGEALTVN